MTLICYVYMLYVYVLGVSIGMCSVLLVGLFDNENIAFSLGYVTTTTSFAYLLGPVVTGELLDTYTANTNLSPNVVITI